MRVIRTFGMLAALLGAAFVMVATETAAAQPGCAIDILFVAGTDPAPSGDASFLGALEAIEPGASCVTVIDDNVATAVDAKANDVVVISSSVTPTTVDATFRDVGVPVLVSEPYVFAAMGMASGGSEFGSQTTIRVLDPAHPLAAGRAFTQPVYSAPSAVNIAFDTQLGPDAIPIAASGPGSPRITLFGYESSAAMAVGTAPAGRVGFFAPYDASFSSVGVEFVDAAVQWLSTQGPPVGPDCTTPPNLVPYADLRHCDLSGLDLSGVDLTGADLTWADLTDVFATDDVVFTNATLAHAKLVNADFGGFGVFFDGVDFTGADASGMSWHLGTFTGADFSGADFSGTSGSLGSGGASFDPETSFESAQLDGPNFAGADLRGVDFRNALLDVQVVVMTTGRPDFTGADVRGADFTGATILGGDLRSADFSDAVMAGATLGVGADAFGDPIPTDISDAEFSDTDLAGADLTRAFADSLVEFTRADLASATLVEADLLAPVFNQANLTGVDGRDAQFLLPDFQAAHLGGADFTDADLSRGNFLDAMFSPGTTFAGSGLAGALFAGTDISGVDFSNAGVSFTFFPSGIPGRADLSGVTAIGANFEGAILRGADMSNGNFTDASFRSADLSETEGTVIPPIVIVQTDLSGSSLRRADVTDADLTDVHLMGADLTELFSDGATDLSRADLSGSTLVGADLFAPVFEGADFSDVQGEGAAMTLPDFGLADLTGADFSGAALTVASFGGATFSPDSSFAGARLFGAGLSGTDISGVDFSGATLTFSFFPSGIPGRANLSNVIAHDADFGNAILRGSDLSGGDFRWSNFVGADLSPANGTVIPPIVVVATDVSNADFTEAAMVPAELTDVGWSNTTCPDGTNSDDHPDGTCLWNLDFGRDAVMIAGESSLLSGDVAIHDLLVAEGFDVTIVDDDSALGSLDLTGIDLLLISTSVVPTKVGSTFAAAPVPTLVWEGHLFDDMGLATFSSETSSSFTDIVIVEASDPLAAGLPGGARTVYTGVEALAYGFAGVDANVVAHVPGFPARAVLFDYETGDTLVGGSPAPAARVAAFPSYDGAKRLTADGLAIMAAAIAELTGSP